MLFSLNNIFHMVIWTSALCTYINLTELYVWNEWFNPEQSLNTDGAAPRNHNLTDRKWQDLHVHIHCKSRNGNIHEVVLYYVKYWYLECQRHIEASWKSQLLGFFPFWPFISKITSCFKTQTGKNSNEYQTELHTCVFISTD